MNRKHKQFGRFSGLSPKHSVGLGRFVTAVNCCRLRFCGLGVVEPEYRGKGSGRQEVASEGSFSCLGDVLFGPSWLSCYFPFPTREKGAA